MPVEDKEKEGKDSQDINAEDEISKSTGNDTDKFAKSLEDDVDQLIKDVYHSDEDDKDEDDKDEDDKDEDKPSEDGTGEDEKHAEDKDEKPEPDKEDDGLTAELDKAQKRVKDTRADYTKKTQELAKANEKTVELQDSIFDLQKKVETLTNEAQTKAEEKKTSKAVEANKVVIEDKLAAIKKVDPDLYEALKPVVGGLAEEVNSLRTEMATKEKATKEREAKTANDVHFSKLDKAHDGWEDTLTSPEFKDYLKELSSREKRLALFDLKEGRAEDIIEIFDDFKTKQTGDTDDNDGEDKSDKKKNKVAKARTQGNPDFKKAKDVNRGVQSFKYTRTEIANMEPKEYAKNEADIDKAMAAGEIENR